MLPEGECIQLTSPAQQASQIVLTYSPTDRDTINSPQTNNARSGPPNSSPDRAMSPPCHLTKDLKDQRDLIRVIWGNNCASLDAQRQMSLWQLL